MPKWEAAHFTTADSAALNHW